MKLPTRGKTKVCTRCARRKERATGYYRFKGGADGYMSHCKDCVKDRFNIWRAENPKKLAANRARSLAKRRAARLAAKKKAGRK